MYKTCCGCITIPIVIVYLRPLFELLQLWINSGISYLSRALEDEARLRLHSMHEDEALESPSPAKEIKDVPLVRMADILFVERMRNKINVWHDDLLHIRNGGPDRTPEDSNDSTDQFQTIFFRMGPAIKLNGFTSRQLRLIKSVMFSIYMILHNNLDMFLNFCNFVGSVWDMVENYR